MTEVYDRVINKVLFKAAAQVRVQVRNQAWTQYCTMSFNENIPDGGTSYLSSIPDIVYPQVVEDLRND